MNVMHGYSLTDLHNLANVACHTCFTKGGDARDRHDAAWFAIVEHLLTAGEAPDEFDLVRSGQNAVRDLVRADVRHRGGKANDRYDGLQAAPRFAAYWMTRNTPSPEDRVVDAITLQQIWPTLTEAHRRALSVYAATADLGLAATAHEMQRQAFVLRLNAARRKFRALWHEGERPSRMWKQDGKKRPDRATPRSVPGASTPF